MSNMQAPINKRPFKQLIFALGKNIALTMTQRVLNSLDWRKEIVNAMGYIVTRQGDLNPATSYPKIRMACCHRQNQT